jgi:nitrate reductase NapD
MNISSIVIKSVPEQMQPLLAELGVSDICDVHFHDARGRIVVTIEGESVDEEMRKLKLIQGMPHVLSAALAYAYSEQELASARDRIEMCTDAVPESLKE